MTTYQEAIDGLVGILTKMEANEKATAKIIAHLEGELKSPRPVDGLTPEEVKAKLAQTLEYAKNSLDELKQMHLEHRRELRQSAARLHPELFAYAQAKYATLKMLR